MISWLPDRPFWQYSCVQSLTCGDFVQLDGFDRKIVAALADEGRLTTVELAARVGLSPSACTRRVQGLEAARRDPRLPRAGRRQGDRPRHQHLRRDHARAAERRYAPRLRDGARRMPERPFLPPDVRGRATTSSASSPTTSPISSACTPTSSATSPASPASNRNSRSAKRSTGRWRRSGDDDRLRRRHRRRRRAWRLGRLSSRRRGLRRPGAPHREGPDLPLRRDRLSCGSIRQQFSTAVNIEISLFGIAFLRQVGELLAVDGRAAGDRAARGRLSVPRERSRRGDARAEPRAVRRNSAPTSSISTRRDWRSASPTRHRRHCRRLLWPHRRGLVRRLRADAGAPPQGACPRRRDARRPRSRRSNGREIAPPRSGSPTDRASPPGR